MKSLCKMMRGCCLKHQWVANLLMLVATLLFVTSLWFIIEYQQAILGWVGDNPLPHILLIGGGVIVEIAMLFLLSLLVFSDCREESARHGIAYQGRRSTLFPGADRWVDGVGVNPKRKGQGREGGGS